MFRDVVWSDVTSISCVAILWVTNALLLFYAFFKDLTLIPLIFLLVRPSFLPPVTKSNSHFCYALVSTLFYGFQLLFLLTNTFNIVPAFWRVLVKCSWQHHLVDTLLGLKEVTVLKWNYYLVLTNGCLLLALPALPKQNNSALPTFFLALGKETIDSLVILVTVLALALAGCSWPSALHAPYFFVALICSIGWAGNRIKIDRKKFYYILQVVSVYLVFHLLAIPVYHNNYVYKNLNAHRNLTNLIGLKNMRDWSCSEDVDVESMDYVGNVAISISLLCGHFVVNWCKQRLKAARKDSLSEQFERRSRDSSLFNKELYENIKKEVTGSSKFDLKSSAIALVVSAKDEKIRKEKEEVNRTELQDLLFGTIMNSTMMVWSVFFHSWLGFVMLMMANVMWLIPRQSKLMKLMVRFVSIYMSIRVSVTYLVSLTYDYPDYLFGHNLHQFGLRYDYQVTQIPLLMQGTMTAICLIVYRQYTTPYIGGLNIPLSGFKKLVDVASMMWVRLAVLVIMIMVLYDVQNFKVMLAPFYVSIGIAMWVPWRPRIPLTVFFVSAVVIAEIKLMLTYVYNFKGTSDMIHSILGMDDLGIYLALGLYKMKGTTLLVHLWLPNILAMFSAIFLTALKRKIIMNLERNWAMWEETLQEFVLDPDGESATNNKEHKKDK